MPRLVAFLAVLALVATAVSFSPPSAPAGAQPVATTRALLGQEDDPTPTPSDDEEDAEGIPEQEEDEPDRPEGVPAGAVEAEVAGHVDGDKFTIRQDGDAREVLLIGVDAPEVDEGPQGECYAAETAGRLEEIVPRGKTVYLLAGGEDTDNKDRLLRFVWVEDDGEALFVNQAMLEEGNGSFQAREGNGAFDDDLRAAEEEARDDDAGLWGECGENHVEIVPPTPTPELGEEDLPAELGTTLSGGGVAVTTSFNGIYYNFNGSTPRGGYVFLVLDVTIENVDESGDNHGYDEQRFSAEDLDTGADFEHEDYLLGPSLAQLQSGDLSTGEYVSGQAVLEVQETATTLRIRYRTANFGGEELHWVLQL